MTFETLRWHADTRSHGFYNLFALCYLCGADLSTGCESRTIIALTLTDQIRVVTDLICVSKLRFQRR